MIRRWRDSRNLSRAVATLYDEHELGYGSGHAGRKWRVASLVTRGVPINKVADVVGHISIATTLGYLGRQDHQCKYPGMYFGVTRPARR